MYEPDTDKQPIEEGRQQNTAPMKDDTIIYHIIWESYQFVRTGRIKDSFRIGL